MAQRKWTQQRVTIKDIARLAKVDPSTVTRALQNSARVKSATRERIHRIATELGYVPSAMARSLVMQRSHLVALVIPDMTNPFFAPLAKGIEEEAAKNNLRILIRNTEGREDAEQDAVRMFGELAVDGLIVAMARCPQSFYDGLESSMPIIHINRTDSPFHVSCDSQSGTHALIRHLLDLGHTQIAFVHGPAGPQGPANDPKLLAYRTAMQEAGVTPLESDYLHFDRTLGSVERIADQITGSKVRPTAVFAWNDVCAIALIHALTKRGVAVPQDISVAGHDDIELAGMILPPLTTVRWPMHEIGINSIRYLLGLRAGYQPQTPRVGAPRLLLRESTAAPVSR